MVAVNSLLYFLLSAGLSSNPDQAAQDLQGYDPLNGLDLAKLCPPNEQLSNCDAHCQKNCTNFGKPFPCPAICVKGCVCNDGLVRDSSGKCVQPKQCPGKDTCPRGEHYEQCSAHCQTNCTTLDRPLPCPRLCVHGCVCDKGTIRGPKGKCITPDRCPKRDSLFEVESSQEQVSESFCPPNEEYSHCSAHCQRDCSNWADEDFKCTKQCIPGCVCREGMVRGPKGQCVWPRQCLAPMVERVEEEIPDATSFSCPANEHFTNCDAYCQKNCSNHDQDEIWCSKIKICMWGCICDEGFTRGPDRKCIKVEECEALETQAIPDASLACPKDEVFSECEAHCQKNCTNWNKPIACPKKCVKGCVCKEGLVRGQDGKCVQPKLCPGKNICPRGEHYDQCNAHCQRNCTTWGKPMPCPLMCVHGCVCDRGTVRGPKGKCIKPNQCPKRSILEASIEVSDESSIEQNIEQEQAISGDADEIVCPKYEHFSACEAHCQKNCTNFHKPMPCPYKCVKGCVCDDQYVRGQNGKCVKREQCPVRDVCPRGEHFDMCYAHCQKNCTNWNKPIVCPLMCVKGCVCDEGTVRGPHGRCVKVDKCPKRSLAEELDDDVEPQQSISSDEQSEILDVPTECTLEKKVGPCRGRIPRYWFNKDTNKCEQFFYGGCQGNKNNFWTRQSCERKCLPGTVSVDEAEEESEVQAEELPEECALEKKEGPCHGYIPRYWFNKETKKCEQFIYGGCQGNKNNFWTKRTCERKCLKSARASSEMSSQEEIEVQSEELLPTACTLEMDVGPCKARIPRYWFNKETNECERFDFGGCLGNENNFLSRTDCERKCRKVATTSSEISSQEESEVQTAGLPTDCTLEKVKGPCKGYFPRYWFNKETSKCEQFIYGGCRGNKNNFETKRHCERKCLPGSRTSSEMTSEEATSEQQVQAEELPTDCTLEKVKGPCKGAFPRYWFNKETNKCEQFIYGGCRGNKNNFETKRHCERKCLPGSRTSSEMTSEEAQEEVQAQDVPRVCTLEKVTGPCEAHMTRYWFNKHTNKCERFIYGGCRGNGNNFRTKSHCEKKCLSGTSEPSELNIEENIEEESEVQAEELPVDCTLEKVVGPCKGRLPRYWFNKETNKCELFYFGGCQGNKNNFWTKRVCESKCLKSSAERLEVSSREESEVKIEELPTECSLDKVIGPCEAYMPRYWFNKETMQCESFFYGGCQGNENNFETLEECNNRCPKVSASERLDILWPSMDVDESETSATIWPAQEAQELPRECTLEQKVGPCNGHFPRYWFNKETNQCEQFIYSGCQGNENNFETRKRCEQRCSKTSTRYSGVTARVNFCPKNEEYSPCRAHCVGNCKYQSRQCPGLCVSGCKCIEGYVRGPRGDCIKLEECPSKELPNEYICPVNERFDRCSAHCQGNCTVGKAVIPCPKICVPGCVCERGFIRGYNGMCIPMNMCLMSDTEQVQDIEDSTITYEENVADEQGAIDSEDGVDSGILPFPKICKKNEVFSLCPCPKDCSNYETKKCVVCVPGCECAEGYVNGPDGTCIKVEECQEKKPDDCTDMEFHDTCGSSCPDDCTNYMQQDRQCDKKCVVGCLCLPGTVRSPTGDCIFPFDCPAKNPLLSRN